MRNLVHFQTGYNMSDKTPCGIYNQKLAHSAMGSFLKGSVTCEKCKAVLGIK